MRVVALVRVGLRVNGEFDSSGMGDGDMGVADGIETGEFSEMGSRDREKLDVDALGVLVANGEVVGVDRMSCSCSWPSIRDALRACGWLGPSGKTEDLVSGGVM